MTMMKRRQYFSNIQLCFTKRIDLSLYTSLDLCVDAMPWHRDHQRYYQQLLSYIIVDVEIRRMILCILLCLALYVLDTIIDVLCTIVQVTRHKVRI